MKRNLLAFLCGVLIFGSAGMSYADPIKFDLDFEYSGGANPVGPAPWLTATFEDLPVEPGSPLKTVMLTLNADGLTAQEFVSSWSFNIVYANTLFINFGGGTGPEGTVLPVVQDARSEGPAFGFDIKFEFPTSNSSDARFGAEEIVMYYFSGIGLTASAFNFENTSGKGPFYSAAHVQSIGFNGSGSGYIGTGGFAPIPEPATMLLLGIGLTGLAYLGRKKFLK
jgi:hypothetical protein